MARRTKKFSQECLNALAARLRSLVLETESTNDFCRRAGGIDSGNMSRYMNAAITPTLETIVQISHATGVTLDWLVMGHEPKYRRDVQSSSVAAIGANSIAAGGSVTILAHSSKVNE